MLLLPLVLLASGGYAGAGPDMETGVRAAHAMIVVKWP